MPQAVSRNTTTQRARNSDLACGALIAAHRKALGNQKAADTAYNAVEQHGMLQLNVPEIGSGCVVFDKSQFDRLEQDFIKNRGLSGVSRLDFLQRMKGYRVAFACLEELEQQWRKRMNLDELEEAQSQAHREVETCWKALVSRAKSHPRDVPEIARYLASEEAERGDIWRLRALLLAIAGSRRAVRR